MSAIPNAECRDRARAWGFPPGELQSEKPEAWLHADPPVLVAELPAQLGSWAGPSAKVKLTCPFKESQLNRELERKKESSSTERNLPEPSETARKAVNSRVLGGATPVSRCSRMPVEVSFLMPLLTPNSLENKIQPSKLGRSLGFLKRSVNLATVHLARRILQNGSLLQEEGSGKKSY